MSKKKILIVSKVFYPVISPRSFRATELAKEFSRLGHDVTVFTDKKDFDYEELSNKYGIKIKDIVINKWFYIKDGSSFLNKVRILLHYLFHFPDIQLAPLLKKRLNAEGPYDILISIAVPYPVHWGVALAKQKNENLTKVWVADCGDPFMGNKETRLTHPFYFRYVENWFCGKPDYITIPIKEAINAYPQKCKEKIKVIPQGFNFDEVKLNKPKQDSRTLTFGYAGAFYKGLRDPRPFLNYLSQNDEKEFRFIVYTNSSSMLDSYRDSLGDKLEIRDYIPREQLLQELSTMDFLVNFENVNKRQSPSKLIDYTITDRPILSINTNELDPKTINDFLNQNYENQLVIDDIEQYAIDRVAQKFLSLLK